MATRLRDAGFYNASNDFFRKASNRNDAKKDAGSRESILLGMGLNFLDLRDGKQAAQIFERCLKEFPTSANRQRFTQELDRAKKLQSEL